MISESVRRQLNYVHVGDPDLDLGRFPDFLIVGPQRTGTTWLHAQLRYHPQILLSEPKELFFFSRLKTPNHPKYQSSDLAWYLRFFRDPSWVFLAKMAICLWRYREPYWPRVRGEATASYAVLDGDVIDEIVALNPHIKILLMIRDPVQRAWSHAKKDLVRNRKRRFEDVKEAEFLEFFGDDYQRHCARYVEHIERWSVRLQDAHLFVGLFDDIARRPEELLRDVMSFLGVRCEARYIPADVRQSVNPTEGSRIPPNYRAHLEDILKDEIVGLRERLGLTWTTGQAAQGCSFVFRRPPA